MLSLIALTLSASPLVIAHRGASGDRPEHTLAAYQLAIEQQADFIEPDLVMTKDGVLVARHENEIGGTTDVSDRPEFAARRTIKTIDGERVVGWFTEDFTLAELKTLRAKERIPKLRPQNTTFDGQFPIPTFAEVAALARSRGVGIYPELKHPSYFRGIRLPMEGALLEALKTSGLGRDRVFIQCFEVGPLQRIAAQSPWFTIQLIDATAGPIDRKEWNPRLMTSAAGLREIAKYADGVGLNKALVLRRDANGNLGSSTGVVADAHAAGLKVHVWTFRNEAPFLPPALVGNPEEELRRYLAERIDGVFADSPATARQVIRKD